MFIIDVMFNDDVVAKMLWFINVNKSDWISVFLLASSAAAADLNVVTLVTFSKINHKAIYSLPAFLPPEVQFLWKQAATITPLPGLELQAGERGPESTDSEKEKEQEMVEAAEREEEMLELGPQEVWRRGRWFIRVVIHIPVPAWITPVSVYEQVHRHVPESELLDISGKVQQHNTSR